MSVGSNGQPHVGEDSPTREERIAAAPMSAPAHAHASAAHASVPASADTSSQQVQSGSAAELRRERVRLAERVASLTWDLGGLAYEMAIRDHYRLDVLARRAAELQQADAQLGEVERLLASAQDGVGGACRACGAVHSRGAAYCWRCGSPLLVEARPSVA